MFRPSGFAELEGKRVGLFGFGVEGRAAAARLAGVAELVIVDDARLEDERAWRTGEGGLAALATCDVVLKSPGVPRRRADVLELEREVTVTSALNLWLHDVERDRVIAVTGTKGKSTTTALITFLLESVGDVAQSLGNIGRPPYDPTVDDTRGWLVVEVSSFQCLDLDVAPAIIVVTTLGSDHLDWHGSLEQYHEDKLALTRAAGEHLTLVGDDEGLLAHRDLLGGEVRVVARESSDLARELGLLGTHNDVNVALALAAASAASGRPLEQVRDAAREHRGHFQPLRGRLTLVATETLDDDTIRYVDDGLATSVLPTRAALEVFSDVPVSLIVGGYDRGVDYADLVEAIAARGAPTTVLLLGPVGDRVAGLLEARDFRARQRSRTMRDAVVAARSALPSGGVVLFSPAAPSFDAYRNWEERSTDFTNVIRALLGDQKSGAGEVS